MFAALALLAVCHSFDEKSKLDAMAVPDTHERVRRLYQSLVARNDFPQAEWLSEDRLRFVRDKRQFVLELAEPETQVRPARPAERQARDPNRPARGRQYLQTDSPDGRWRAMHRDRNVWLVDRKTGRERAVTRDGNERDRVKYGTASWVYGEELGVREAMGFSPDSKRLWFYRFDEKDVRDFYLTLDQTQVQNRLDAEPYPKAGAPNPRVSLLVHDLASGRTVTVATSTHRDPMKDLGHYVYAVRWSPDGGELLFHRTDRLQRTMEFCAADPSTGKVRVVVREGVLDAWTDNAPPLVWLDEEGGKRRFLWIHERNGFRNLSLGSLDGGPLRPITAHPFDVERVVRADPRSGWVYYTCRSAPNPYLIQLHRIRLDGSRDERLTDPAFSHSVTVSPDGTRLLDTFENLTTPPKTVEMDLEGTVLRTVAEADASRMEAARLQPAERVLFRSADGKWELYGYVSKPVGFDPSKRYPLVVMVYAGPESGVGAERFVGPHPLNHYGFAVAWFEGRGTVGRGREFRTSIYGRLGVVEIDDQAAGVRAALSALPWLDPQRVGITGTSYGGYASIMALLRHPDVFHAAVASSSVTDWRNYDSIYTERYMGTPETNPEGYREGSAMEHVQNLRGKLLLFYGTADNNVHPSNTHQLIRALDRAGKRYELQVGPDAGHEALDFRRTADFFARAFLTPDRPDALERALRRGRSLLARARREALAEVR
ncbi:MAG: S9 family peptidase [Fimbriimonadales bacterium]|nr:S9 family peptidase [Fimbriimonadales bacterium]